MATLLRVPFGLLLKDNVWVGPEDVEESGLACECICPSCKIPLVLKRGSDRVDHFSHHTRQQHGKVRQECEYSFWVACATMGRQLLQVGGDLNTPNYSKAVSLTRDHWSSVRFVEQNKIVRITAASTISFSPDDIAIGEVVDLRLTDAVITVHGLRIFLFFVHPEHETVNVEDISRENTGALVIDLTELLSIYQGLKGTESFKERIQSCLFDSVRNKRWMWHPREARVLAAAEEEAIKADQEWNEKHASSSHRIPDHRPKALASSRSSPMRQVPKLTGRWCNISCECGNIFRDFVQNNNLESVPCRSCGLLGKEHLRILS